MNGGDDVHHADMKRPDPVQREKARNMRRSMTRPELELWRRLNRNQLGVHFRRQHPVGMFIVDFAAVSARIVVDVDGATHHDLERERLRDTELQEGGWRVLHFTNQDIEDGIEGVVDSIRQALGPRSEPDKIDRSLPTRQTSNTGTRSHPTPNPSQREGCQTPPLAASRWLLLPR